MLLLWIAASHQASGKKAAARILQVNSQEQETEVISGANPAKKSQKRAPEFLPGLTEVTAERDGLPSGVSRGEGGFRIGGRPLVVPVRRKLA